MRPAIAPLTPVIPQPRPAVVELTREELRAKNSYLRFITTAERRRHAAVERSFVRALDELQNQINDLRLLYVEGMAQRLTARTQ